MVSDERLAELYASADLFVLPSRYEGYGMAYTEAIAHGLPVVGTTAGAIPEAVPRGAGMLVAPDNVGELTLALMRLIGNPAERARLTAGARAAAATLADLGRRRAAVRASAGSRASHERLLRRNGWRLREPYDLAARNATVLDAMLAAFRGQASISVVDLACGTGSTLARASANGCRRGRTGGWSTTISACSAARRRWDGRRTSRSRRAPSISCAISSWRSTGRST